MRSSLEQAAEENMYDAAYMTSFLGILFIALAIAVGFTKSWVLATLYGGLYGVPLLIVGVIYMRPGKDKAPPNPPRGREPLPGHLFLLLPEEIRTQSHLSAGNSAINVEPLPAPSDSARMCLN